MKTVFTILTLAALSLMAEEEQTPTYLGTLSHTACTNSECSYATYTSSTPLVAIIEGKKYTLIQKNPASDAKLEVAIGHDDVSFIGKIDGDTFTAESIERVPDKTGFLGLQSCVSNGEFIDCNLKKYHDGDTVVAVIEGKVYTLDKQNVSQVKIDHAIMRNDVGFFGSIEGNTFKLENMIYEGPAKSFFKGCV